MQFVILAASLAAGLILGGIYFGGLWWTVRRIPESARPAQLMIASWLIRMAVLLAGLLLATAGDWTRLAVAMLGVLAARTVLIRRLRPAPLEGRNLTTYGT